MSTPALASNVLRLHQPSLPPGYRTAPLSNHSQLPGLDQHDLLESVWQNSSDAMRITDSEGLIIGANDSYCRMVEMRLDELVGRPFTDVFDTSASSPELLTQYQNRFESRIVEALASNQVRLRNGKEITVEASNSYIRGKDGATFLLSIMRDTTARQTAEKNLRGSEQKYHDLFNNAMQGVFQSTVDGRLLTANAALLKLLGYDSFPDLADKNLADLYVDPEKRKALSRLLSVKGSCSNIELLLRRKDGAVITVLESSRAVRDESGEVIMFEGMLEDITERRKTEEALEYERNLLRTLMDNLPDLIYFKDAQGRYVLNNRAHLRSLGVELQEDVVGKTTFDFNPLELAELYFEDEIRIVHSGQPLLEREELAMHKDRHERRWHLTSKIPLVDSSGKVAGIVGISRDITDRKELEAKMNENLSAAQASREQLAFLNGQKDRLMSVLSHDLRSPFTSILGFCEILLTDGDTLSKSECTEFLTYIRDAAKRQLALLNKLLDWSRIETGRAKFDVKDLDLASVVSVSVKSHLGTARQKEITLQSTLPGAMKIRGDEEMLMQVFNNLVSNALKFTPKNGLISFDVLEETDEEWVVAIRDTGRGIPKEDLHRLFKVEEKYTTPGLDGEAGTGLGLSLVAEIVKKHGGTISVESEVGKGTSFIIRLPKILEQGEESVLVVDDDEGIRVLHSRFLKKILPEMTVVAVSNGKDAFEDAKRLHPRLIVTDYSMPEMNGYEFLNLLKGEPSTRHIPVLVITGKGSLASSETLMFTGAAAVLDKPVSSKQLAEAVGKIMLERI